MISFFLIILFPILSDIESTNGINQVGDKGSAIGFYQITPVYVDDCNRIIGYDKYSMDDRKDKVKSEEIMTVIMSHYSKLFINDPNMLQIDKVIKLALIHRWGGNAKAHEGSKASIEYADKVKVRYLANLDNLAKVGK